MYQDSKILIENMNCEAFLELGEERKFNIFRNTYRVLHKFSEKNQQLITSDPELTSIFTKIVHLYMKYSKNTYNMNMFEKIIKKESNYTVLRDFLEVLRDSMSGFNFDLEVKEIREANNRNIKILVDEQNFLIYQVTGRETLKKYGSPHWCIVNNDSQYNNYVKPGYHFYVVLQRNPIAKPNFKLGVTVDPKSKEKIKHSFNYDDVAHVAELEQYREYFEKKSVIKQFLSSFFKRNPLRVDNNNAPLFAEEDVAPEEAVEEIVDEFYANDQDQVATEQL